MQPKYAPTYIYHEYSDIFLTNRRKIQLAQNRTKHSHRKLCLAHQRNQGHVSNWEALEDATLLRRIEEKSPLQRFSSWFLLGLLSRYSKPKEKKYVILSDIRFVSCSLQNKTASQCFNHPFYTYRKPFNNKNIGPCNISGN